MPVLDEQVARNRTVDVAKGMAGILVVLGHALAFRYQDGALLQLTHLTTPLYIFLSGVFIKVDRPWGASWLRLADALLKPYCVVLLAWGIWHAFYGSFDAVSYLVGVLYGTGITIVLVPLWFLPHLFLCRVVGKSFLKNLQGAQSKIACLMLAVVLWVIGLHAVDVVWSQSLPAGGVWQYWFTGLAHWPGLPFSADVLPLTLACFLMGFVLSEKVQHCRFRVPRCLLGVAVIWVAMASGAAFDVNRRMVSHPLSVTALAAAGLYVAVTGAAWLMHFKKVADFLSYLGRYFLLVLLLHLLILRGLFHWIILCLPHAGAWQIVWLFVIGMSLSLLLVEVVRRSRLLSLLLLPLPRTKKSSS